MDVTIREAIASDYDNLTALFEEVDALHREKLPWMFKDPGGMVRDRDYMLGLMEAGDAGLLVAQVGDELAGLVSITIQEAPEIPIFVPRRYAVVENLVVKGTCRRKGIGRALMAGAHEWATARGAGSVELTVYQFNRQAFDFYRALGYETTSRRMTRRMTRYRWQE